MITKNGHIIQKNKNKNRICHFPVYSSFYQLIKFKYKPSLLTCGMALKFNIWYED